MAARVVLLSFKDDRMADKFIAIKDKWEEDDAQAPDDATDEMITLGAIVAATSKMEAVVARPSNPCTCVSKGIRGQGKQGGYTKTKKFGWWVHAGCAKPEMRVIQDFIKHMLNGANDLLPELRAKFKAEREAAAQEGSETNAPADAQGEGQAAQVN